MKPAGKPTASVANKRTRTVSTPQPRVLRPYSLSSLFLSTLLFSLIAGGLMAAINWRRLKRPELAVPVLIGAVIGFILIAGVFAIYIIQPDSIIAFVVLLIANVAYGIAIVTWQRKAYDAWVMEHGEIAASLKESGFFTYSLVVLIGVVAIVLALQSAGTGIGQLMLSLRPAQTIQGDGVTLIQPNMWIPLHDSFLLTDFCNPPESTCLYASTRLGGPILLGIRRLSGEPYKSGSVEQADQALWALAQEQATDTQLIEARNITLDGKPAIRRTYTFAAALGGRNARLTVLVKDTPTSILQFDLISDESAYNQLFSEIEAMVSSLRF